MTIAVEILKYHIIFKSEVNFISVTKIRTKAIFYFQNVFNIVFYSIGYLRKFYLNAFETTCFFKSAFKLLQPIYF